METYFSNGKLLITGEYVVLDGAIALAVPTILGQSLTVEINSEDTIQWKSVDDKGEVWYADEFYYALDGKLHSNRNLDEVSDRLIKILEKARQLNINFLNANLGACITTKLDFPNNWGLGTSSTLINNIAQWAQVDPYELLDLTFGGSGYDIAIAQLAKPLTYQLSGKSREIKHINYNPPFTDCLYFVHLNKKQNSRDGIAQYNLNKSNISSYIQDLNEITSKIITCENLIEFESLIDQHELIISNILNQKPVKQVLFNDYNGSIKSLGAWGGDFILVTSKNNPNDYFMSKGYNKIIPYKDLILI